MDSGERSVRVTVQTKSFTCEASVVVPRGGYRGRVLDLLNADTQFVALTDVRMCAKDGGPAEDAPDYPVLLVRKGEIVFVEPLDGSW